MKWIWPRCLLSYLLWMIFLGMSSEHENPGWTQKTLERKLVASQYMQRLKSVAEERENEAFVTFLQAFFFFIFWLLGGWQVHKYEETLFGSELLWTTVSTFVMNHRWVKTECWNFRFVNVEFSVFSLVAYALCWIRLKNHLVRIWEKYHDFGWFSHHNHGCRRSDLPPPDVKMSQ